MQKEGNIFKEKEISGMLTNRRNINLLRQQK